MGRSGELLAAALLALTVVGCKAPAPETAVPAHQQTPAGVAPAPPPAVRIEPRNLSADEARGGHTLARHVGRSDAELAERLRLEPQISAASTYPDRPTAERVVATALEASSEQVRSWEKREGIRPNLVVTYRSPEGSVGRCLVRRGGGGPRPCASARVILRWDARRDNWYVLTSYPDTP